MAIAAAATVSRIGATFSTKANAFRKSVGSFTSDTFSRTRDKMKVTKKKVKVTRRKRDEEDKKFEEKLDRQEKEGLIERKKKKRTIGSFMKGFPSKVGSAFLKLLLAWAIDNLPKITKFITTTTKKIRVFAAALKRVLGSTYTMTVATARVMEAVIKNLSEFDTQDKSGRIEKALDEFNADLEELKSSTTELKDVWSRDEEELDKILKDLESGKSMDQAIKNAEAQPQTPAFGPGSRSTGTQSSELKRSTKLLASYEGFREDAYPDPYTGGAPWTIGFGSTKIDGRPVRPGDRVTREQALEMKKADVQSHRAVAIDQVGGIDEWMKLSENTRVALNSIVYNYGSLPGRIMPAVRSRDPQKIAEAIRGLGGDNKGINRWRRNDEAQIVATGKSSRVDIGAPVPDTSSATQAPQTAKEGGGEYELTDKVPYEDFSRTLSEGGKGAVGKTSDYGFRKSPGGVGSTNHKGVDIGTTGQGNWFCAIKVNGKVTYAGTMSGYGKIVIIKSGQYEYRFAHLRRILVKQGDPYNAATPIGEIGNTGHSTGTHLHFETLVNGSHTDPNPYLNLLEIGRLSKKVKAQNAQITGNSQQVAAQVSEEVSSMRTTNRRGRTVIIRTTQVLKTN